MTTQARIGYQTTFQLETTAGSGVYQAIGEITKLTPPNEKADVLDATNFDSPNGNKEFVLGLSDPGEIKFDMNLVPGSSSETLLLAAKASRSAYAARITFPAGQVWDFAVLITDYAPDAPVDKLMTCSVTGKVSGSVVRS
jgi:hypothetical protein